MERRGFLDNPIRITSAKNLHISSAVTVSQLSLSGDSMANLFVSVTMVYMILVVINSFKYPNGDKPAILRTFTPGSPANGMSVGVRF